jgi:ubiquinone biosynthesis protein UbiJ
VIEITGPVARTIPVVVEGGRAKVVDSGDGGAPAVTVTMDTETFLVLAVGRQTAEQRAGQITVDGDADLGQAIVGNLNMMI